MSEKKLPPIDKKLLLKALADVPKLVKQKEKAAKEKEKILKSFEAFSKKLKRRLARA